jgi:hypothetical protein
MIPWDYDSNQYSKEDFNFPLIPEGEYRVKMIDVKYKLSSTGKDMYVLKIGLVDEQGILFYNMVFDPDNRQRTNQNLGRIFDSFDIPAGEMDSNKWIGQIGAVKIKHETYKEKERAAVENFLTKERQEELGFLTPREIEEDVLDLNEDELPI